MGAHAHIEAFFACLAGTSPPPPCTSTADFNGDGDVATDADIEAFFRFWQANPADIRLKIGRKGPSGYAIASQPGQFCA